MDEFFVFFVFEAFVGGKSVIGVEVGVADLVDDVFADEVYGIGEFALDLVEVTVNRLLQQSTLGLDGVVYRILAHQPYDFLFAQEDSRTHVVMILFNAEITAPCLSPDAAV